MLKIGITGGIGAGKTLVTKIFAVLGVPVYDADSRTRRLQNTDPVLIEGITRLFGKKAYGEDLKLDREYIASIVFADSSKLEKLNALVHPSVFLDFENWCDQHSDRPYVLKESALLFETGFYKDAEKSILVTAPVDLRIRRVLKRDPFRTEADVRAIISKQMPDEEKIRLADFVLHNDETNLLVPQVLEIDATLKTQ